MADSLMPDPADPAFGFMTGTPEAIIGATREPRILVTWLHGNEHLGARVGHHLQSARPDLLMHVDYLCGNPRAAATSPQQRFTLPDENGILGTDMNRSFKPDGGPRSYEERRAAEWVERMRGYDFVIDLHTSTTDCGEHGRFFIAAWPEEPAVRNIIASSTIERVVVMPPRISEPSLIGQVPNAISIEYDQNIAATARATWQVICMLDYLARDRGQDRKRKRPREFYYVEHEIPRQDDPGAGALNFVLCAGGYYPVLLGENSYRNDPTKLYVGFAATATKIQRL